MSIFDFYKTATDRNELATILQAAAQNSAKSLPASFLEKDLWIVEILRLLYEERVLGEFDVAFKGGTSLSKCWSAIDRFSEDIDLSIHWADLAGHSESDEFVAWSNSTKSRSQGDKFRDEQNKRLLKWSNDLVERLNYRFKSYELADLTATIADVSNGEMINITYPHVTSNDHHYHLDHILLEFGGRNRGKPTESKQIYSYLSEISGFEALTSLLPTSQVQAYDKGYIIWEKLTALHQFSTQKNFPAPSRLARHWYDVDCIIQRQIVNPLEHIRSMLDIVELKTHRFRMPGVDYQQILHGQIVLLPGIAEHLQKICDDHANAINGGLFFSTPPTFELIMQRLSDLELQLNHNIPTLLAQLQNQ